jgi:hypothetical protein
MCSLFLWVFYVFVYTVINATESVFAGILRIYVNVYNYWFTTYYVFMFWHMRFVLYVVSTLEIL